MNIDDNSSPEEIKSQLTNQYILRKSEDYVEMKKRDPSFFRDILPYYTPLIISVSTHILYFYTGNMLLPGWLMYIGTPLYNLIMLDDDKNIEKKNEKAHLSNKLYVAPLWGMIIFQLLSYLWCLALFSTNWKPDHWLFEAKPETTFSYIMFALVQTFFTGVAAIAGHELVHR